MKLFLGENEELKKAMQSEEKNRGVMVKHPRPESQPHHYFEFCDLQFVF